ncbi:hypothetical protein [Pantanalinema sp. GBBB05]|uniref:hypothetical protein n=1 Tax=Pantanalinema sp. GBBB05 TaxID=2604139 RepID=UPI001D4BFF0B|nr:hypothetical protein [Pantanalinema sp. GBBB05]
MKSPQAIAQSLKDFIGKRFGCTEGKPNDIPYSLPYLVWMCDKIIENPQWEIDKSSRWIGYIQGVMVARFLTSVERERDRVRNIDDVEVGGEAVVITSKE